MGSNPNIMRWTTNESYWNEQYRRERALLLEALGDMVDGGRVERIEHIGTTSIPGLYGHQSLDLALAVWPYPLDGAALEALAVLGYKPEPATVEGDEQRFRHADKKIQLSVLEAESAGWQNYLLIRDYLRHNKEVQHSLSELRLGWESNSEVVEYQALMKGWFDLILRDAHRSWIEREGFEPLRAVAKELQGFSGSWYVGGGWALDLFLGQVTRVHHDVDVSVSRADQLTLQQHLAARGWKLATPYEGRLHPWPMHMRLELPRHQVHAHRESSFIDFLLTDFESGVWRYRREPHIIRDMGRVGLRSTEEIPFLAPELVLLFKSRNTSNKERDKDESDFEGVYKQLEPERRAWLRWALIALNPSHPWLMNL